MSRVLSILLFAIFVASGSAAQTLRTMHGRVCDSSSGEAIAGAAVEVGGPVSRVAVSDGEGCYALALPEGRYDVRCSCVGYAAEECSAELDGADVVLPFLLVPQQTEIEAVVVTGDDRSVVRTVQAGAVHVDLEEMARMPVLFGERDLMKSLQLLPGVRAEGDGACGFQIRGGTAAQNLVLLDDAPVTNPGHMMGFFSAFNSDAVGGMTLYKAPMPVQYGGRVASALDVRMKDGGLDRFGLDGGVGLISARLALECPIADDRTALYLAGRRTYADAFLAFVDKFDGSKLNFYDLNARFTHRFSERDRISLSGYFGRDNLVMRRVMGLRWGNGTASALWSHSISDDMVSRLSLLFSHYRSSIERQSSLSGSDDMAVGVRQWGLREEFLWSPSASHDVRFGVQSSLHRVVTGEIVSVGGDGFRSRESEVRRGWENAVWIGDEWHPCERLGLNFGVRLETCTVLGGSPFYRLDESGGIAATEPYRGRWDAVRTYAVVEPRVSVNFMVTERSSVKLAYGRTSQNIHSVSSSSMSSPFDRYVPSSNLIRPEVADHVSAGYARTFGRGAWELSVEGYWKSVDGQLDYRDATIYSDAVEIETLLLAGRGRSYGAEVLLRRSRGRVTGWIAYTLSRSENRIPGIDSGRWYTAGNDRTHDLSVVAMWSISPRWELSASWVFASGQAMTLPSAKYWMENVGWLYYYDRRNASRAPASHRLDISAVYRLRSRGRWSHELVFGLYNAYNRYNPYMITFEETAGGRTEAMQYSLFGAVPFVSYNFKLR